MKRSSTARIPRVAEGGLELTLAHSPDADDAFMFYALATSKIRSEAIRFNHVLEDIQTLNEKAQSTVYDVTAVSFHAYAYLAENYILLPSGASFGDGYGPIVVGHGPLGPDGLRGKRVAVPGKMTTAYLALLLYESGIEPLVTPFDQIIERVASGGADAGVVIHEGQLTYSLEGLSKQVDLGEWWLEKTGLPLPLGGNAIRRSLGPTVIREASKLLTESIRYGLDHREEALVYATQFSRGLDVSTADRFIAMYVNDWTLDYGERGREAVQLLLDRGFASGVLPAHVQAEFVDA
ncbi:MAG TPA: MqnA/MqnD/SBP family protein [Terriglobia bacterium]|nr:MqnA/MqnD/SBP family protein [Terriglobia bacterium]